ncbi:hypothetical protein FOQG_19399 [Fusarium oxysporum f. sp. raphani 54005]|uniref:Uncharacterized protein n=1 Tax=Fusarium oxysporum f. sp. raphani 54005 TaxID=1089458 RepID=X0BZ72_FUSOX|nr:hypothetical protein FOQG_19399 [Fusarium oxysporum f. sp. raphani 54005]
MYHTWHMRSVTDNKRPNRHVQTPLDFATLRKEKTHMVHPYLKLLGAEPLQTFNKHYEKVKADWNFLKSKTNIPNIASISDPRIICSFKVIDLVICRDQSLILPHLLAYIRLMDLLFSRGAG